MKISIYVTEHGMQFNLTPESEHEKRMVSILREHNGTARIHHGVNVEECRGGYIRSFGDDATSVAITIQKADT